MKLNINHVNLEIAECKGVKSHQSGYPALIFLHDSLGCIQLWKQLPQTLCEATGLDTFVYDRQGYGASDPFATTQRTHEYMHIEADVLITLMDQLKIQKAILIGFSDGGTTALIAGARYPERITSIITIGAHVFVEDITREGIANATKRFNETDMRDKLIKYHGDKTDALFYAWSDTWLSDWFADWSIVPLLSDIHCPVMVIQGERDEFGSEKQVDAIIHAVKGKKEKCMIPNAGHSPHVEQKALTSKKLIAFITQHA